MASKPLRIAALVRVSTEKQERRGESLRVQLSQMQQAVEILRGEITRTYGGQEHATPGWDKQQLAQLLSDAAKKRRAFDAVMVFDASRWSRDNASSKAGLDVFRNNGIRFYTLTKEYHLHDPRDRFYLGLSAELGELEAAERKLKSTLSCIARAKRIGAPTSGRKPYGRLWEKKAEIWGLDPAKKAAIEDIAKRYLTGESMEKLAREYGINHSFLNKTLAESCGGSYTISWDIPDLNIKETVEIEIPRLLPEKTIKAIRQKAERNRTHSNGKSKHEYLLGGYIFCGECGYSLTGQFDKHRYYRHRTRTRGCQCTIRPRPHVRADQIEDAVIRHLFETFGNRVGIERAIDAAIPNRAKVEEARKRIAKLQADLPGVETERNKILTLVRRERITMDQAEKSLDEINAREAEINGEIEHLAATIEYAPTPEQIKSAAEGVTKRFRKKVSGKKRAVARLADELDTMTWEDKRGLIELVFAGQTVEGRPMGVYVEPIEGQQDHRQKQWAFTLYGIPPLDGIESVTNCSWG